MRPRQCIARCYIDTVNGDELRRLRVRHALTQRAVAAAAGIGQPELSAIEHGRRGSDESRLRVERAIRSLARPVIDAGIRSRVRALLAEHGVERAQIIGSVARGDERPGSDLDILAVFPPGFDLFELLDLEAELEEIVGVPVDLVSDDPRTAHALRDARRTALAL